MENTYGIVQADSNEFGAVWSVTEIGWARGIYGS